MNRIRLLPDHVANQIAAGEVVERPASVVKELVENALDAQSGRIDVEIQAGGRSLVRVIDDGIGMSRDDALLCLERHATSKIRRAEDLSEIATMGFRGEALPSIASVSRFTLTTRERDSESPEGTQVIVNGGKIVEVKSAGSAPGTTVEVRQLFFNLPARRKFLRTEETEGAHIQHYLALAALAHPQVAFTFQKDGRPIWQLPSVKSGNDVPARLDALRERLSSLYGDELKLLSANFCGEISPADKVDNEYSPAVRLWGFIGAPGVSRATREDQHLFINRRPVENRGLNFALLEGYHTALMKGRYPVCCLFVEIDPAAVDVNIHPAKREVKFHREFEVRRLVTTAVRQALLKFHGNETSPRLLSAGSSAPPPAFPGPAVAISGPEPKETVLPNFPEPLHPRSGTLPPPAAQPVLRMGFGPRQSTAEVETLTPGATASVPAASAAPAAIDR